jgi:3',5'-nucleoside bisphosphate phosphatase
MISSTDGLRLTPGDAVDLQLHTDFSDGRWTLESLLEHLRRERFALAAITDHDRVDTMAVVQQAAHEMGVPVLVAVEMTSAWEGGMVDLLCFGFDPAHGALGDLVQGLVRRQQENSREVFANLRRLGCDVGSDVLDAVLARPSSRQPQAWVDALREAGHGAGGSSAGELVARAGCSFATNDPAAVVEATQRAGGVCLLAHPGRADGFVPFDDERLDRFRREVPIDGLEVPYPLHSRAQTATFRAYAQRHGLLTSAGSDSHGPERPPVPYLAESCRGLLERLGSWGG